jgi:amino acid transporter
VTNRTSDAGASEGGTGLHRALGLVAVVFYCFGDILGAGVYALVGVVAATAGAATPLAFGLALAVAAATGLCYAEISSRHPRAGVEVFWTRNVFGSPKLALLVGWTVLCSALVSAATVSHAFARYLREIAPGLPTPLLIAVFAVGAAALNFRGIAISSRANIVATCIETSGLLIVVAAGAAYLWRSAGDPTPVPAAEPIDPTTWRTIAQGGALAFFAFIGFEDVVNIAEEVKRPRRNLPRGILVALALAGVLYIAVAWVTVGVLTPAEVAASEAPLVQVVRTATPLVPGWLFALIAVFAVANTGLLNSITASRLLYGMASQGLLPSALGAVHSDRRTPHRAILVCLAATLLLALSGSLTFLAGTTSVLLLLVFSTVNLALLVTKLRERRGAGHVVAPADGDGDRPFHVPLVVPVAAVGTSLVLLRYVPAESLLRAAVLITIGCVLVVFRSVDEPAS